jgi:hypothetical protein
VNAAALSVLDKLSLTFGAWIAGSLLVALLLGRLLGERSTPPGD